MKKIFILILVAISFVACKKTTTSSPTNTTNPVTCGDNPNINFKCIGTPIGKFGDSITDVDGNVYKTVTIGTQIWMAENLKTTKYNDGTIIPNVTDSTFWSKLTSGAWCYNRNDATNNCLYGKLYNWYAVSKATNGNKNVCPTGWHVPSKIEWDTLINYLGGDSIAGGKMKEIGLTNWKSKNNGATNISLFCGLPGDCRGGFNEHTFVGFSGNWWSSTNDTSIGGCAWNLSLENFQEKTDLDSSGKGFGLSVRCLKD